MRINEIVDKTIYGLKVTGATVISSVLLGGCGNDYISEKRTINQDTTHVTIRDPVTNEWESFPVISGDVVTYTRNGKRTYEQFKVNKKDGGEAFFTKDRDKFSWGIKDKQGKLQYDKKGTEYTSTSGRDNWKEGYNEARFKQGWKKFHELKGYFIRSQINTRGR